MRRALRRTGHRLGVPAHARAGTASDDRLPGADRHRRLRPPASHPHGYTRPRYSRFLGVPEVFLLGHSHGGFVAQYHALHHPERIAGVILYESAPLTGPEHGAEAMRLVQSFAALHADHPELPEVLAAFQAIPTISDDAQMTAVARGLLPAYFADYWVREEEFAPMRASVRAAHISGLDENLSPLVIDDRADLGSLSVPTLVVGRHDVVCAVRWAEELHLLIPGSELLILENSGHFGHLEEPEAFSQAVTRFVTAVNSPDS
ncbi:alpha/beta fold hydrolase [Streptomyces mirabilis]|uniref:alpha/beta fold hydrolase n=1 Tax=Streptomyces mirabilis TaxID=68239 RepID=UPI00332D5521